MRIRFLGTGYGECKNKKKSSKEYRGRGGVIVDDHLLIDAPLDILESASELGLEEILNTVTDVIISHSHPGHFSPEAIYKLSHRKKLRVFASEAVLAMLAGAQNVEKYEIGSFMQFKVGQYTVATLPSNHTTENLSEECFNFLVMADKTLLYALDGGFFNTRAYNVIHTMHLDALILDGAIGTEAASARCMQHNSLDMLSKMKEILDGDGVTHEKTRFIISHVPTDKKLELHEVMSPIAQENGMTLAYDGYFARV